MDYHLPAMVKEVCELLGPRPGDTIADCNLGSGGHSLALLDACGGEGFLVGLDLDTAMLSTARLRFRSAGIPCDSYALVHANHSDLAQVLGRLGRTHADRVLMDLGAASPHFDDPSRGFSCREEGPLDMRYDQESDAPDAARIVNTWSEGDLTRLFREKGDERWAKRIAQRIVGSRENEPLCTTTDLARLVAGAIPRKAWPRKLHVATRVFLALRVEVNQEEESLKKGLDAALECLAPQGRLAVLTWQGNEDRLVKRRLRKACRDIIDENDPFGRVRSKAEFRDLTRKPLTAGEEEVRTNRRSRSAKLRGVERIAPAQ